jgi:hypothetical protein
VFSIEPGIYVAGEFGLRFETIYHLGADGPEALNAAPRRVRRRPRREHEVDRPAGGRGTARAPRVDALEQQVAAVRVLDPRARDLPGTAWPRACG